MLLDWVRGMILGSLTTCSADDDEEDEPFLRPPTPGARALPTPAAAWAEGTPEEAEEEEEEEEEEDDAAVDLLVAAPAWPRG